MAYVRPLINGEEGLHFPARELLEKDLTEARRLAGEFLVNLYEMGELTQRPLVVELDNGITSEFQFCLHPDLSSN